jgi:hypothetical protein
MCSIYFPIWDRGTTNSPLLTLDILVRVTSCSTGSITLALLGDFDTNCNHLGKNIGHIFAITLIGLVNLELLNCFYLVLAFEAVN